MTGFEDPDDVVRRFLRWGTGCAFAARFSGKDGPILWVDVGIPTSPTDDNAAAIDTALSDAASEGLAVAIVLSPATSERDLVTLLLQLAVMPGWSIRHLSAQARPTDLPDGLEAFALEWRTRAGDNASVMVVGPLLSFPVHRRAQYLALLTWTGGRENRHLSKRLAERERPVGFVDMRMPDDLDKQGYDHLWAKSRDAAKAMRGHAGVGQNSASQPEVGFCLSRPFADELLAFLELPAESM